MKQYVWVRLINPNTQEKERGVNLFYYDAGDNRLLYVCAICT